MRYNSAESPQFMDSKNQNTTIVMSAGARTTGEPDQNSAAQAMQQLKETI